MSIKVKAIIVNATAIDRGGALTILCQFLSNIPPDDTQWIVFTSGVDLTNYEQTNIKFVPKSEVRGMFRRVMWDTFGLSRWLKQNNIEPIAGISLQNTGFRLPDPSVPQFIYFHNILPLLKERWNPFKAEQRTMSFYRYIYPFFVRMFLTKKTNIIVQLPFIKDAFIAKFNHPADRIMTAMPEVSIPEVEDLGEPLPTDKINLFYPASGLFYKNHHTLLSAIDGMQITPNLYLTNVDATHRDYIKDLGTISYKNVIAMYHKVDALVFPSFIETIGLPLIEAAKLGIPIVAADMPFAHQALDGYEGVTYVDPFSPEKWRKAICSITKHNRYTPIDLSKRDGWCNLFSMILK